MRHSDTRAARPHAGHADTRLFGLYAATRRMPAATRGDANVSDTSPTRARPRSRAVSGSARRVSHVPSAPASGNRWRREPLGPRGGPLPGWLGHDAASSRLEPPASPASVSWATRHCRSERSTPRSNGSPAAAREVPRRSARPCNFPGTRMSGKRNTDGRRRSRFARAMGLNHERHAEVLNRAAGERMLAACPPKPSPDA